MSDDSSDDFANLGHRHVRAAVVEPPDADRLKLPGPNQRSKLEHAYCCGRAREKKAKLTADKREQDALDNYTDILEGSLRGRALKSLPKRATIRSATDGKKMLKQI